MDKRDGTFKDERGTFYLDTNKHIVGTANTESNPYTSSTTLTLSSVLASSMTMKVLSMVTMAVSNVWTILPNNGYPWHKA